MKNENTDLHQQAAIRRPAASQKIKKLCAAPALSPYCAPAPSQCSARLLQRPRPLGDVLVEVDDIVLVLLIHKFGSDHKVRRGLVVGDGDVVDLGDAQQRLYIRVVGLGGEGIGEEDHKVDPSFYDLGADLLVTA